MRRYALALRFLEPRIAPTPYFPSWIGAANSAKKSSPHRTGVREERRWPRRSSGAGISPSIPYAPRVDIRCVLGVSYVLGVRDRARDAAARVVEADAWATVHAEPATIMREFHSDVLHMFSDAYTLTSGEHHEDRKQNRPTH